jgi:hypothetical protein
MAQISFDSLSENQLPNEFYNQQYKADNPVSPQATGNGCPIVESGPDAKALRPSSSPFQVDDPLSRERLKLKLAQDVSRLESRLDDIRKSQQLREPPSRWSAEEDRGTEADEDDDRLFLIDFRHDVLPDQLLHPDTLLPLPRLLHPDNLHPFVPRPTAADTPLACPLVVMDLFFLASDAGAYRSAAAGCPASVDIVCQVGA